MHNMERPAQCGDLSRWQGRLCTIMAPSFDVLQSRGPHCGLGLRGPQHASATSLMPLRREGAVIQ